MSWKLKLSLGHRQRFPHTRWEYDGYYMWWDHQGSVDIICSVCKDEPLPDGRPVKEPVKMDLTNHKEWDIPPHCDWCHRPLKSGLTPQGYEYIIEALREDVDKIPWGKDMYRAVGSILPWYEDSPHFFIRYDWLDLVRWFGPSEEETELLDRWEDEARRIEETLRYRLYWSAHTIKKEFSN
jgi:hypothetical protein